MMTSNLYSIEASRAPTTGRRESHFIEVFDAQPGERILDLASGRTRFSELKNVVQLDHVYGERPRILNDGAVAVAGLSQQLPFKNNSFDRVTMRFGSIWMSEMSGEATIEEALRVLVDAGSLEVYPVIDNRRFKESIDKLTDVGYEVDVHVPKAEKKKASFLAALSGVSLLAGVVVSKYGYENPSSLIAFMGGGISATFAYHYFKSGVLRIKKNEQLKNPRQQRIVARQLAPFATKMSSNK